MFGITLLLKAVAGVVKWTLTSYCSKFWRKNAIVLFLMAEASSSSGIKYFFLSCVRNASAKQLAWDSGT